MASGRSLRRLPPHARPVPRHPDRAPRWGSRTICESMPPPRSRRRSPTTPLCGRDAPQKYTATGRQRVDRAEAIEATCLGRAIRAKKEARVNSLQSPRRWSRLVPEPPGGATNKQHRAPRSHRPGVPRPNGQPRCHTRICSASPREAAHPLKNGEAAGECGSVRPIAYRDKPDLKCGDTRP